MLGGDTRFVLSTSGHIAAIVNPPGNQKASYRVAEEGEHDDPDGWLATAEKRPGSWWEDWNAWLAERSGPMREARSESAALSSGPRERPPARTYWRTDGQRTDEPRGQPHRDAPADAVTA